MLNTKANYLAELSKKRRGYTRRINELGAIKLDRDVAGVVDVLLRGWLYGVWDALARCSQICLAVNIEENEVGICLQRRVVVGRMGIKSSSCWRLRREEELGGEKNKHQPGFTP